VFSYQFRLASNTRLNYSSPSAVQAEPCEKLLGPPKKSRWGPLISASIEADACFFESVAN